MIKKSVVLGALIPIVALPAIGMARVTTFSGGLELGYEYYERNYKSTVEDAVGGNTRNDDDYSRLSIAPIFILTSETERDRAVLSYSPKYYYDLDDSDDDLNHLLLLEYGRAISQRWSVTLIDEFENSDETNSFGEFAERPEEDEPAPSLLTRPESIDILRDEEGRRRYYSNELELGTSYNYREDSFAGVGVGYDLLRNDIDDQASSYEDYDKYSFFASLAHRFDPRLKTSVLGSYTRGTFEDVGNVEPIESISDDLNEYGASLVVESNHIPHHPSSLTYEFLAAEYDEDIYQDAQIHALTLATEWFVSQRTTLALGAGPTYTKEEDEEDEWQFNGFFQARYGLEKGSIDFSADAGTEFQNFSGTVGRRSTVEFWQAQLSGFYLPAQYTELSVYVGYRDQKQDELVIDSVPVLDSDLVLGSDPLEFVNVNDKRLFTGCSISQRFMQYYVAKLAYKYVDQSSDFSEDEYEDHRIELTLSYQKDFFRW